MRRWVYWLEVESKSNATKILSIDFHGEFNKTIQIQSSSNKYLLGGFGNLIYFLEKDLTSLNEINILKHNKSRKIVVQRHFYLSMTIVQPGKLL